MTIAAIIAAAGALGGGALSASGGKKGGGSTPKAPGLTDEQRQLLQSQTQSLDQARQISQGQYQQGQQLNPLLLARQGITPPAGQPSYATPSQWQQLGYSFGPASNPLHQPEARNAEGHVFTYDPTTGQLTSTYQQGQYQAGQQVPYPGAPGYQDMFAQAIQDATRGNLNLAQLYQTGAQNAASGNLEQMNPALTQYLNQQRQDFQNQAFSHFGPGYEQSTPYQNANYYQNLGRTNALAGNQLNYMGAYQNLANAALGGSQANIGPGGGAAGANVQAGLGTGSQLGQIAGGYSNPFANLNNQNLLGYQGALNMYNANAARNAYSGQALGLGLIGATGAVARAYGNANTGTGGAYQPSSIGYDPSTWANSANVDVGGGGGGY